MIEKTIKQHPQNTDLRAKYGLILLWMGENKKAIHEAMLSLDTSAPHELAFRVVRQAYLNQDKYSDALKFWENYARLHPDKTEGWLAAAYSAYKAGELEKAQKFTIKIFSLKGSQAWDEFFENYQEQDKKDIQIFSINQKKILPIVLDSLKSVQ